MKLRTQLLKIMRRAGVQPWPRLWQNMRATRETELVEEFPAHVVSTWVGHSVEMGRKHYLQVTDEHFKAAAGMTPASEPQITAMECDSKAVQNPVQFLRAPRREAQNRRQHSRLLESLNGDMPLKAEACEPLALW